MGDRDVEGQMLWASGGLRYRFVAAALLRICKGVIQVAAALFTTPVAIDADDGVVAHSLRIRAAAQALRAVDQPTAMADGAPG